MNENVNEIEIQDREKPAAGEIFLTAFAQSYRNNDPVHGIKVSLPGMLWNEPVPGIYKTSAGDNPRHPPLQIAP